MRLFGPMTGYEKLLSVLVIAQFYLPALVMIISVPTSSNLVQSSLSCRKTLIPSSPCKKK